MGSNCVVFCVASVLFVVGLVFVVYVYTSAAGRGHTGRYLLSVIKLVNCHRLSISIIVNLCVLRWHHRCFLCFLSVSSQLMKSRDRQLGVIRNRNNYGALMNKSATNKNQSSVSSKPADKSRHLVELARQLSANEVPKMKAKSTHRTPRPARPPRPTKPSRPTRKPKRL